MKSNANWYKKLAICLALTMVFATSGFDTVANAAVTPKMEISTYEDTQVLIMGETYKLEVDGAVSYKSSNPTIASVTKDGDVTPKKTGAVTFVATVKKGKKTTKVSKRYYIVNPQKTTSYQTTFDKMLEASNITKMVLKNLVTDSRYVIKAGDYTDKLLYVNTPYSDVRNTGTFKKINIVDVGDTTWREYAKGNVFNVTDKNLHFVAATAANVKEFNVTGENQYVVIDVRGTIQNLNVSGNNNTVVLNSTGDVQNVTIANDSNVVIRGTESETSGTYTAKAAEIPSADGKSVTFALPAPVKNLKGLSVTLATDNFDVTIPLPTELVKTITDILSDSDKASDEWTSITNKSFATGMGSVVITGSVGPTKTISYGGLNFTATWNETQGLSINRTGSKATFVIKQIDSTHFSISNDKHNNISDLISFKVTY